MSGMILLGNVLEVGIRIEPTLLGTDVIYRHEGRQDRFEFKGSGAYRQAMQFAAVACASLAKEFDAIAKEGRPRPLTFNGK